VTHGTQKPSRFRVFRDREEAGRALAAALPGRVERSRAVILGIPRGGVIVAAPVGKALAAPLEVVIPHKLRAPDNPELAIGAIAPGVRVLDDRIIRTLHVSDAYIEEEVAAQEAEIVRRTMLYRGDRPPPSLADATAIVVDDGIATGATAVAALRWARAQGPARVVFAAPVGPRSAPRLLANECDDAIVLETPPSFRAVGEWYERFDQVEDREVLDVLRGGP
jgi:putative phosphoribosyl transferase